MTQLHSIVTYMDSLLPPDGYKDYGLNGLQVEAHQADIRTVAVAVDAGLSVIEKAIEAEADLLVVHHGLFWGTQAPLTGALARKLQILFSNNCSLYASHLPLDGSMDVGNGVELARFFGLQNVEPAFEHAGGTIGVVGSLPGKVEELSTLVEKFSEVPGALAAPTIFPFGPKAIKNVGIVTGSGCAMIAEAKNMELDLLISGEPKQEGYHLAKESGIHALFLGHYATETFGVKAVAKRLEKDFDLSTVFVHEPTGV